MNLAPNRSMNLLWLLAALLASASMLGCQGMSSSSSTKSSTQQTTTGDLSVTPGALSLGSVAVGASGTATGSLTATGADVTVTSASSSKSGFVVSGISLPMTIPAGQTVEFTVTFSPLATGAASATLTFASNASHSTITDALSGTGTNATAFTVNLSWNASSSSNIVGYNIYRSGFGTSCGGYAKLNSTLYETTSYGDSTVTGGQSYCYVTTAVNSSNQESTYSAAVEATIPSQ
jgi:hypothetical protein